MQLLFNVVLAWISVILAILLAIIYIFRILTNKLKNETLKSNLKKINKALRKPHKIMGILLVVVSLVHGLLSSQKVISPNKGTLCFIIIILLGLSYYLRKYIKRKGWMHYHRILTVMMLLFLIFHIIEVGFVGIENIKYAVKNESVDTSEIIMTLNEEKEASTIYKDGTYIGEGVGFRPGLKVEVEIKDGLIKDIEIIEHNELNSRFYDRPIKEIPEAIIESQSPLVDAISGATMTSYGIMTAVNDALSNAILEGETIEIEQPETTGHFRKRGFH